MRLTLMEMSDRQTNVKFQMFPFCAYSNADYISRIPMHELIDSVV